MHLHAEQSFLLETAERFIKHSVSECGTFPMFALALQKNGNLTPVQVEEFQDTQSALDSVLETLLPLAVEGQIFSCIICTPMPPETHQIAVYDIDHRSGGRVLAVQSFKKKLFGGWAFGEKEFKEDASRLFVS